MSSQHWRPGCMYAGGMRVLALVAVLALPIAAQVSTPFSPVRVQTGSPGEYKSFNEHLFGRNTFIRSAVSTSVAQLVNGPREWGQGPDALGKRFAASFGRHMIRATVQYSMAETLRQDLRYHPSDKDGFGGRLKHALMSTVVARDMDTGNPTFASARVVGAFAGGFVSRTWMPDRLQTAGSGFRTTGISFGFEAGCNVLREFWPDIRGKRRHRSDTP
jgi:hypothetical protein